jgi:ABC-2 type transport system ATP-binding protein
VTEAALLEAQGARIAIDDAIALDRIDLEVVGPRLLVLGDAAPLIAALTGTSRAAATAASYPAGTPPGALAPLPETRVVAGSLRLAGFDVARRDHVLAMGAVPLDPPLPPDWTAVDYVERAMRFGGVAGRDARKRAAAALEAVGLGYAASRAIRALAVPERRALPFAAAHARDVRVVVADEPLAGLEGHAAAFVLAALGVATQGRGAILSARSPSPAVAEGVLFAHATQVCVIASGEIAFTGSPSMVPRGATLWGLTVRANADVLAAELERRGVTLRGGPLRFSATLPEGASTREIVAAAVAARAPVVELVPLW